MGFLLLLFFIGAYFFAQSPLYGILYIAVIIISIYAIGEESAKESNKISDNRTSIIKDIEDKGVNLDKIFSLQYSSETIKEEVAFSFKEQKAYYFNYLNASQKIISFNDVVDCEIIEDNSVVQKGGIGRAVVGGIIAGGVGAVVGATTRKTSNIVNNLAVRIITKDAQYPMQIFSFIDHETKRDSDKYKYSYQTAQELYSTFVSIINSNSISDNTTTYADELRNLSALFKDGIISQDEFENKKSEILSNI